MYGFPTRKNQQRKWTAILTGDASRCAATTGQFEIRFVRLEEVWPDLVFIEIQLNKGRLVRGRICASGCIWRGAADMQGFVACALSACLKAAERDLKTPLQLALSYDEEIDCVGVHSC
jgi:hypothetical protein